MRLDQFGLCFCLVVIALSVVAPILRSFFDVAMILLHDEPDRPETLVHPVEEEVHEDLRFPAMTFDRARITTIED